MSRGSRTGTHDRNRSQSLNSRRPRIVASAAAVAEVVLMVVVVVVRLLD